jgi:nucleoside-diphosphate-sugar epimerase
MLHRIPSLAKIERAIGWRPQRSLDEILDDVVAFERARAGAPAAAPADPRS